MVCSRQGKKPLPRDDRSPQGFTLLEVLVAMVLIALVTLVCTVALRLTITAWDRGQKETGGVQLSAALPTLMDRQLASMVTAVTFNAATGKQPLPFSGESSSISFFTAYAPMGSALQGLLRITYQFDAESSVLKIYQQVITRREDLKDENNPLSDKWNNSTPPMSQVKGIIGFSLRYTDKTDIDPFEDSQWKDSWGLAKTTPPTAIEVSLQLSTHQAPLHWFIDCGTKP